MSEEQKSGNKESIVLVEKDYKPQETSYHPTEHDKETHKGKNVPATFPVPVPIISSDKHKEDALKSFPSKAKGHAHSSESIGLISLQTDKKRGVIIPTSHPIPADKQSINSEYDVDEKKQAVKEGEDSIVDETARKRDADVDKNHSEWSDDEGAGGLPRSDSRASRVSRAVRQLFCCGVAYEAASEENISTKRRHYSQAI